MSQPYQPSSFSSSCLPLVKFSFATVAGNSSGPIPWVHLSSSENLFAVFEVSTIQNVTDGTGRTYRFRVLKDPDVLEDINLNVLGIEARRAMVQVETNPPTNRNPAVMIIVKCPRIAIRYPTNGSQVRRFQVCFSKEEDYREAMNMLSQANVPTTEAGAPSVQQHPIRELSTTSIMPINDQRAFGKGSRPVTAPQLPNFRPTLNSTSNFQPVPMGNFLRSDTFQSNGAVYHSSDSYDVSHRGGYEHQYSQGAVPEGFVQRTDSVLGYNAIPRIDHRASEISHVASPAINFYAPRPSTAPTKSVRELEYGLPPRRELPFTSSPSKAPLQKLLPKPGPSSQPAPEVKVNSLPIGRDAAANSRPQKTFLPLDYGPEIMSKEFLQRQQASKTKAKRKMAEEPTDDTESNLQEQHNIIPTKNENIASQAQPPVSGENIDTQALLEKAEAKQKKHRDATSPGVPARTDGDDEYSLPTDAKGKAKRKYGTACQQCRNKRRRCVPNGDDTSSNCQTCKQLGQECSFNSVQSSQEQFDNNKKQIVQVRDSQSQHKEGGIPEDNCNTPSVTAPVQLPEAKMSQGSGLSKVAESPQTTCSGSKPSPSPEIETIIDLDEKGSDKDSNTKDKQSNEPAADLVTAPNHGTPKEPACSIVDTAKIASNLHALLQDPNFARTRPVELAGKSFSDLPGQEQDDTLQSYLVSVIDNDEFVNLCKRLDGIWERVFVRF